MSMKKKVIALVVDTELTNEQIEKADLTIYVSVPETSLEARNVRVLDSD